MGIGEGAALRKGQQLGLDLKDYIVVSILDLGIVTGPAHRFFLQKELRGLGGGVLGRDGGEMRIADRWCRHVRSLENRLGRRRRGSGCNSRYLDSHLAHFVDKRIHGLGRFRFQGIFGVRFAGRRCRGECGVGAVVVEFHGEGRSGSKTRGHHDLLRAAVGRSNLDGLPARHALWNRDLDIEGLLRDRRDGALNR